MTRPSNLKGSGTNQKVSRSSVLGLFHTRPSEEIIQEFLNHVRETGEPETYEFITRERPIENSRPVVLKKFDVDRNKRKDGDEAPCSICSPYKPKCLHGMYLVWYPDEAVIRAIGPECGNSENNMYELAFSDYEVGIRRKSYEDLILKELPRIVEIKEQLERMRPAAIEVDRIRKIFKNNGKQLMSLFRKIYKSESKLTIEVELENSFGPNGVHSSTGGKSVNVETVYFGKLYGEALFTKNRSIEKLLAAQISLIKSLPICLNEEFAFNWLCENEALEVLERVSLDIEQIIENYNEFKEIFLETLKFFDADSLNKLNNWGNHYSNSDLLVISKGEYDSIVFKLNRFKPVKILPKLADIKSAL